MMINIKLNRRQFVQLLAATGAAAITPTSVIAKDAADLPIPSDSWVDVVPPSVGDRVLASGNVTLAGHTMPVEFCFDGEKWCNMTSVTFPQFTQSHYIESVMVQLGNQEYEAPLSVAYHVLPGDVASFPVDELTVMQG